MTDEIPVLGQRFTIQRLICNKQFRLDEDEFAYERTIGLKCL